MYSDENYIKITKIKDNESIEIHQNYVRLRESTHNKLMAFNIKAPLFETAEIERWRYHMEQGKEHCLEVV